MFLSDQHIHSRFSFDSEEDVERICQSAVKAGLTTIAFTEHFDLRPDEMPDSVGDALKEKERRLSMAQIREKYAGRLEVLNGLELGTPQYDVDYAKRFLAGRPFDIILGSAHYLPDGREMMRIPFASRREVDAGMEAYFATVLEVVRTGLANVVAHIAFPLRALGAFFNRSEVDAYYPLVDQILQEAASRGMALEVSTKGLRTWQQALEPEPYIVKRYKAVGGKYVTIGSDAHEAPIVGMGVALAMQYIASLGFSHVTVFRRGEPELVRIA